MFDYHVARRRIRIVDLVLRALALFACQDHQAFGDFDVCVRLLVRLGLRFYLYRGVGGIGEQAAFVGVNGSENAFSSEGAAVDDVKRARVECLAARVLQPKRTEGTRVFVPHCYLVCFNRRVQDRDEGGLILGKGDSFSKIVLEKVAHFFALRVRVLSCQGGVEHAGRGCHQRVFA